MDEQKQEKLRQAQKQFAFSVNRIRYWKRQMEAALDRIQELEQQQRGAE
jgi:truncated hemoglobin YjbI